MIESASTIAHYRVETLIGAGGMGEVYKAVDSRLGRSVALKILPPDLSHSRERIRRFLQEAKAASSLNHPNIVTVYDAGEAQGVHFIATELVEGSTLRDLIHGQRAPLKRIVGYLAQAADGLAKAHAAGIVHRDLKPDNIMVTADGFAKVLDFGLAKLTETRDEQSTLPDRTRDGLILGTVRYMSPEQAQGKPVDHRSDVFAFGAILYEAAARQPAFPGDSDPDILHRIIYEDPAPVSNVPVDLHRVITRAMAKDPDERLQSMKDLALELRDISRSFDDLKVITRTRRRTSLRPTALIGLAAASLTIGIGAGLLATRERRTAAPVRFDITPPPQTSFTAMPNSATALQFAMSPDGKSIAFVASRAGVRQQIWVRDLSSVVPRPIAGTEGAWLPFWSPDGEAIAFFAEGKLKRVAINGGAPVVLANELDPRGGTWSRDGVIVFTSGRSLARVPAEGGDIKPATKLDTAAGEFGHRWPAFFPDGKRFVFFAVSGGSVKRGVYWSELGSTDTHFITATDSQAIPIADDAVVFMRKGSLFVQRLDPGTLAPRGEAVLVERNLGVAPVIRFGAFSSSFANALGYAPWVNPSRRLTLIDRHGNIAGVPSDPADWGTASLTLHAREAFVTRTDPDTANLDLWLVDTGRGVASRVTSDPIDDNHPVVSPDGTMLAFSSVRTGRQELYVKHLDGQREEMITTGLSSPRPSGWSPDGKSVICADSGSHESEDVWLVPIAPRGTPRRLVSTTGADWAAIVSPNGKWIAYVSDIIGRDEVYVQPFPSGGEPYRVSTDGAMTPKWSPDGRELFFSTFNGEIASARVTRDDTRFECDKPSVLFKIPGLVAPQPEFQTDYAVTADGKFLFVITPAESPRQTIQVALNWRGR